MSIQIKRLEDPYFQELNLVNSAKKLVRKETRMKNNIDISEFNEDDVLSFESASSSEERLVKANKFKQVVHRALSHSVPEAFVSSLDSQELRIKVERQFHGHSSWIIGQKHWCKEGVDCKVFRLGSKGWQKGKMKLSFSLEFILDEEADHPPIDNQQESPLDDIRQMINEAG
jgi:hypothetical protein